LADEGELGADGVGSIARRWPTVGSRAQRRRPRGELRGCGWRWPGRRSGVEGSSGRSREDKEEEKKIRKKEENRRDKEKKKGIIDISTLLSTLHSQEKPFCQTFS
jgi:hypothetical protein